MKEFFLGFLGGITSGVFIVLYAVIEDKRAQAKKRKAFAK